MNKKLTLLLDESTINDAKQYAQKNKQSLSQLVETYFRYLTNATRSTRSPRPTRRSVVDELTGIISVPKTLDHKTEYREHRAEKALNG